MDQRPSGTPHKRRYIDENKHVKRCSLSYVIRKIQIKTAMRCHYTLLEWPKSRTLTPPNAGADVEQQEFTFTAGGNVNWYSHCGRQEKEEKHM